MRNAIETFNHSFGTLADKLWFDNDLMRFADDGNPNMGDLIDMDITPEPEEEEIQPQPDEMRTEFPDYRFACFAVSRKPKPKKMTRKTRKSTKTNPAQGNPKTGIPPINAPADPLADMPSPRSDAGKPTLRGNTPEEDSELSKLSDEIAEMS